ncbi:hypothetical protein D3C78_641890 [compost metagenome]
MDDRHRQRQALANAQRQAARQFVAHRFEIEALEHFRHSRTDALRQQVEQPRVQFEVLQYGQLAVQRERLRHVANPPARLHVLRIHRLAEQRAGSLAGRQQAGEHLHGGGLAAAVGAEEAEDLPALDAETDVIDRNEIAEAAGQVVGLDGDAVGLLAWRNPQLMVAMALALRQQGDEGGFQRRLAGAFAQLGGRAGGQHPALVHRHQPVEALGLLHVGGRHQHAHAPVLGADALDQLPELVARQRVDAGGRLVEDQQVGIVDQRAAQPELLLHAAGELARRAVGERRQPGAAQQVGDAPLTLGLLVAKQAAEEIDVLEHRQRRIQILAQPLRHVGDARADRAAVLPAAHVAAEHGDLAVLHPPRAGDQRQQAGLADAVRADQADHAVGRDLQADLVDRTRRAVAQRHPGQARHAVRPTVHSGTLICRFAGHSAWGSRRR